LPESRPRRGGPVAAGPTAEPFRYGQLFWLAYLSNTSLLVAVALLYRYADFVRLVGGSEYDLGWIVGIGTIGSLGTRLLLGAWIDRYGTRPLWIASACLFAATCFAHLAIASCQGAAVYLLRISYCCAVAGANGASMTFISKCGPKERLAELVGMLGTASFLGAVIGTLVGDFVLGSVTVTRGPVVMMFVIAGALGLVSLPLAWAATRKEGRPPSAEKGANGGDQRSPLSSNGAFPMFSLLRRHNPGTVLAVGVAMGAALGLPTTFLRTHATQLGIPRMGLFFMVYAVAAIVTRILTRRWSERFGARPVILLGVAGLAASLLLWLPVGREWQLMLPAVLFGCSHAVLFPSTVAAASAGFPLENRGLAIILILATWDVGLLFCSPAAGAVIRYAPRIHLNPYPTLFVATAALVAAVGAWYAYSSRRRAL
jgi:MFS family permease